MTTKNEHTGDLLKSKPTTDAYRDGWERIFGKSTLVENDKGDKDVSEHEVPTND